MKKKNIILLSTISFVLIALTIFSIIFFGKILPEEKQKKELEEFFKSYYNQKISSYADENAQLKLIGANAFKNCTSLKEVIIPERVQLIGFYAFYGCVNIEKVYLNAVEAEVQIVDPEHQSNDISEIFYEAGKESGGFEVFVGSKEKKVPDCLF